MSRKNAFTLIEILIVVVILGILAAIVVPKFSDASTDASESTLASNLLVVRKQLELYKLEHSGQYPSTITQLTEATDKDGKSGGDLGPYLYSVPANPFVDGDNATKVGTKKGAKDVGWIYDSSTGSFAPADEDHTDM
jgi:general secretion pathway protein G